MSSRACDPRHDVHDLAHLARQIEVNFLALPSGDDEVALDAAALELRRLWLARAHQPADATLKSPCEGVTARMPDGGRVSFGYERDLDASVLERRSPPDHAVPAGWVSTRVVCRSGQAALACLLHLVTSMATSSRALAVHHAGRYFETASLLDLWPRCALAPAASQAEVDVLVAEPVHCDGRFGVADPARLPRAQRALLLDTTLVGPRVELAPWLAQVDGPLAAVFRSGLKLDQAGLELANVGVVQLLVRRDAGLDIDATADALRRIRGLTGSGLTLDELAALSAPWFLDRTYLERYSDAVFANNAGLARAIGCDAPLFDDGCHPSLIAADAVAPFCALRLREGGLDAHRRLLEIVETGIARRGLAVARGGSFGFRGPRYELIEPEPGAGTPFLRVALGFRGGASCQGMVDLLAGLAGRPHLS